MTAQLKGLYKYIESRLGGGEQLHGDREGLTRKVSGGGEGS